MSWNKSTGCLSEEKIIRKIIRLVIKAQEFAIKIGIPNILQPELIKEMIISEILRHDLIHSKRDADACDLQFFLYL